jgi:hypothetical protein
MAALKLVSAPAADPVSLSELKTYLRVDGSTDDTMLTNFISAATRVVEGWLNRKLITQTWDYYLDAFPSTVNFDSLKDGVTEGKLSEYISQNKYIEIPFFPLQSITYLKTYDDAGTDYTMSNSEYIVDVLSEPGRIGLKNSTTWPSTYLRPINGVQIRFICGYGASGSDVPRAINQAILEMSGKFYSSRGCDDSSIPSSIMAVLAPYRIMRI